MTIHRLQTTVSTMLDAAALAAQGAPHGTVVVAEEQTGGIGRHGHAWHSPGAGLYMSIILRLAPAPILTMALGLAVQRAVEDVAGVSCDLRWPNDLLVSEKKLAGILVRTTDQPGPLIAGIGVNVNQTGFPDYLSPIATSLRVETGRDTDKDLLLDRIIAESLRCAAFSKAAVLSAFSERSSYVHGKHVDVDGRIRGVTAGLDDEGFLLVATSTGIERIITGGVRPI